MAEQKAKPELNYYILFDNYTQGLALHEQLRGAGLQARIAPTPRNVEGSQPCGMSLLVKQEHIDAVRAYIEENQAEHRDIVAMPCQIRPNRDRFC